MITSLKVGQLPVNWWILWRDRDPVRKALVMAQTLHWVGILQAHLIKNSAQPNRPATWAAVAACLNRDVANIKRWKAGKQTRYAPSDFLALAGCVGLDVRELFPTNTQWVAGAVQLLLREAIPSSEATIFSAYCVHTAPDENNSFHDIDASTIRTELPADLWMGESETKRIIHKTHDAMYYSLRHLIDT